VGRLALSTAIATATALCAAACGLSVTGEAAPAADGGPVADAPGVPQPPGPPAPPPESSDAGADSAPDAPDVPVCPPTSCGYTVPAGWTVVAFGPAAVACPTGFAADDVVEQPVADPGACSCDSAPCSVTTQPDCLHGSITSTYGGTNACANSGAVNELNGGACQAVSNSFGTYAGFPAAPPPSSAGACSAGQAVRDASKVRWTASRACVAPTCAAACDALVPATVRACLSAPGAQTCPPDAPDKHLVGSGVGLACGACGSCAVTSTGCDGSMTFYSDAACGAGNVVKTIATGTCVATGGASFRSYKWAASATGVKCEASAPPAPALTIAGQRTICCR
jgi:hypothetical protein